MLYFQQRSINRTQITTLQQFIPILLTHYLYLLRAFNKVQNLKRIVKVKARLPLKCCLFLIREDQQYLLQRFRYRISGVILFIQQLKEVMQMFYFQSAIPAEVSWDYFQMLHFYNTFYKQQTQQYKLFDFPIIQITPPVADAKVSLDTIHSFQKIQMQKTQLINEKKSDKSEYGKIKLDNRNVLPNSISLILTYIRRETKSGKLLKKILQKWCPQNWQEILGRFYAYQSYLKQNCNDYLSRESISRITNFQDQGCSIFTIQQQRFFNVVCRTLIRNFLSTDLIVGVLGNRRISRKSLRDHLKVSRYIKMVLSGNSNHTIRYS